MERKVSKRIDIVRCEESTEIIIKAYFNEVKQKMFFAWIALWTLSGLLIFSQFFLNYTQKEKVFFIVWMAFWVYFEFKALQTYRWRKLGEEHIRINKKEITIARNIANKGIPATFKLNGCKNFRLYKKEEKGMFTEIMSSSYWVIGGETIVFDYYGSLVPFAMNISEADALLLAGILKHDAKKFLQLSEQKES
ncbi:MAG: hypothetical protein HUU48_11840 [Flavobacteriales bacterium]|nr:hypothetical protein [Flavobacteriales bacterium]